MTDTPVTARELIAWGAELFTQGGLEFHHGTDNALDESASLVMHALGIGYDQPDTVLDDPLSARQRERASALLLERLATRRPAAYLTGRTWFAGLPFRVDERVLVPRSPIAELVTDRFEPWIDPARVTRVLDLCAGSGCIGIACTRVFPDATVDLADLSTDALAVAGDNIRLHEVADRVRLQEADVFDGLDGARYDIIVSNPPYVPRPEYEALGEEFLHEPSIGLLAGEDGLDVVVRILCDAADWLNPGGILVVEVGYTQERLQARFPAVAFTWLAFERGGDGVFILGRDQLRRYRDVFSAVAEARDTSRGQED